MDLLAEKMGISKRTIYERFKDKDTLLLEVINYYKQKRTREAHEIIEGSGNAIEALFSIMQIHINEIEHMNPLFFHDFEKYHTRIYRTLMGPEEIRDFSITGKLLEKGIKQKVFRSDMNIEIVNRTLHELFNLFGHESSMVDAGFHRKEMFDHVIIPYLRGISTEKGVTLLETNRKRLN